MADHFYRYVIGLADGKYGVILQGTEMQFLRYGDEWEAANNNLQHSKLVRAMAERIKELEIAIRMVTYGTLNERGLRRADGLGAYQGGDLPPTMPWPPINDWLERL